MSKIPALRASWPVLLATIAALSLSACPHGAGPSNPAPDQDPEASIYPASDLSYQLRLIPGKQAWVEVTLRCAGSPSGKTVWRIAESWGGIDDAQRHIAQLTVSTPSGKTLPTSQSGAQRWQTEHSPDQPLVARWHLEPSGQPQAHHRDYFYRPIVEADRFLMIGNTGLLFPEHLAAHVGASDSAPIENRRTIELRWEGFAQAGWKVASSHGVQQKRLTTYCTLDQFRQAVFLAGPLRIHKLELPGGQLNVVISGSWAFPDRDFVKLSRQIVEAERDFFSDHDYPHYLISLFPVGQEVPGRMASAGTGLTNSFALFVTPGMSLAQGSRSYLNVAHILAHENFHNWNGRTIQRQDPERLVYWFSEGFTDFYTRRLLYRAGIYSLADYLEELNNTFVQYHTNPDYRARNDEILKQFWNKQSLRELPYQRGALLAQWLDRKIAAKSEGKKSLDDLMRDLLQHSRKTGQRISTPVLLDWFKRYADPASVSRATKVIQDGAELPDWKGLLSPCLKHELRQMGEYHPGFQIQASLKAKRVKGVQKDSAAYRAGLRNGQALRGWFIEPGRPDKKIELQILDGQKRIPISYYPQKNLRQVPWFTVDQAQTCPDIL